MNHTQFRLTTHGLRLGALVLAPAALAETTSSDAGTRRIVNGVETQDFPTAAALLDRATKLEFCSAVLVGCSTALTAAHCVCDGVGSECQPGGAGLVNPASIELFFQHAGFFDVQSIVVPPLFDFGLRDDIAVLRLSAPVQGIRPSPLNSVERLALGASAEIVGFGLAAEDIFDNGLKRSGQITTSACSVVPADEYVCWEFDEPLGPPGSDANTCSGDSGGPMFVDFGSGDLVAGIGSGGLNADCQPDDLPFDADVFANLSGIASAAGSDLGMTECGNLPVVGGPARSRSATRARSRSPIRSSTVRSRCRPEPVRCGSRSTPRRDCWSTSSISPSTAAVHRRWGRSSARRRVTAPTSSARSPTPPPAPGTRG